MSGSIGRDESYLTRREAGKHFTIVLHKRRREGEAKDTTKYGLVSVNLTAAAVCVYTQKRPTLRNTYVSAHQQKEHRQET